MKFGSFIDRLLPAGGFAKSVLVLAGGTAGAQVLLVLAAPILTRLYTPEDFGLVAVYIAILSIVGVVASLRYELAIPLPENEGAAVNIVALCVATVAGVTVASAIAIVLAGDEIVRLLGAPSVAGYLWLLPLGLFLSGCYVVFYYWHLRIKRFDVISKNKISQAIFTIGLQVVIYKLGGVALIIAQVVWHGIGATRLAWSFFKRTSLERLSWRGIEEVAARYARFPKYTSAAGLLNVSGAQLPSIVLAASFGVTPAGLFALASRVLLAPTALVGDAIQNVFFAGAPEAFRDGRLPRDVAQLLKILVDIIVPFVMLLAVSAPPLFAWVFGDTWIAAGQMTQWMTPWLALQFCAGPLTMVFPATENQHVGFLMQSQLFAFRAISLIFGVWVGDATIAIACFSIASALGYACCLYFILRTVGLTFGVFIMPLLRAAALSSLMVAPLVAASYLDLPVHGYIACLVLSATVMLRYYWGLYAKALGDN